MACGGFTCSKNSLIVLNILYIIVAFILIGVASYGRTANYITSVSIVSGIIACGVFLLLISILGILGAAKHHQVFLFFYMLILFILFLVQFSIACACLAVTEEQQHSIAAQGWEIASNETKQRAQKSFGCCGFDNQSWTNNDPSILFCAEISNCCTTSPNNKSCCLTADQCDCNTCYEELKLKINHALKASGGVGLFFSFTELFGAIMSYRYRNMIEGGTIIEN